MPDFDKNLQPIIKFSPKEDFLPVNIPVTTPKNPFDESRLRIQQAGDTEGGSGEGLLLALSRNRNRRTGEQDQVTYETLNANKRYATYDPNVQNLEDYHGQAQSALNRWGNALVKTGAFTLGTFLQGFGTVPDTINAIRSGKASALSNPNGYENDIDIWLKNIEDQFPNYYTDWERDHPFKSALPFSGGFANFWGDKFVKNLGFTAGAITSALTQDALVGIATGGFGDAPLVAGQIGKASLWLNKVFANTDRVGDVLKLAAQVGKSEQQIASIAKLGQVAAGMKVGNQARFLTNLYGAARTEAAMEGRDGYRTLKDDLIKNYIKETGGNPTGQALADIEDAATSSMNARFGINMALLMVSDAVQWDNMLRPFKSSKWGLKSSAMKGVEAEVEGLGTIGLREGSLDTFEAAAAKGGWKTKVGNVIKPVLPSIVSEGIFEEGGQYAAQVGTANYYKNQYTFNRNKKEGENWDALGEAMKSSVEGLKAQFGTTEGLENMFLGSLTGALTGGFQEIGGEKRIHASALANTLSSNSLTGILSDKVHDAAGTLENKTSILAAVANNDVFAFKNLKHKEFFSFINSGLKAGRFDLRIEQLKLLKELDDDQFNKLFGIDPSVENKQTAAQYVDSLISKANEMQSIHKSIQNTYENPFTYSRTPRNTEEAKENLYHSTYEGFKTELSYIASMRGDSKKRMSDIQLEATQIAPVDFTLLHEQLDKKATNEEIFSTIPNIPQEKRVELANLLKDYHLLRNRDARAAQLFDDLATRDGATQYIDTKVKEAEEVTAAKAVAAGGGKTVKLTTARGEQDFVVGEEYFAGTPLMKSDKDVEFQQFVKFSVVGETEDGKVIIKLSSNGKQIIISKDRFKEYKLGSVKDVAKKPNAQLRIESAGIIFKYQIGKGRPAIEGTIDYDPATDKLTFVSLDGKKRFAITRDQFQPKGDFKQGQIAPTNGTLSAAALKAVGEEVTQDEIAEKFRQRNDVIAEVVKQANTRLEEVNKEIEKSQKALQDVKDEITRVTTTKKGQPKKRFSKKVVTKLATAKEALEKTVAVLEEEKEDLESNLSYFQDMLANQGEMSENYKDIIDNIKDDINSLEEIVDHTSEAITQAHDLLTKIDAALVEALAIFNDYVKRLKEENPDIPLSVDDLLARLERFLGEEGAKQFVQEKLGYTEDVIRLEEDISDFRDELKIPDMSKKLLDLEKQINELSKGLDKVIAEQVAKGAVLDAFQTVAENYEKKKAEELKFKQDKALIDSVFKSMDTSVLNNFTNDKDWEPENKKDALQVVTSTKVPSQIYSKEPLAEHHKRSNRFGNRLDSLRNASKIRGVVVSSSNEGFVIPGLTTHLAGESGVDPTKTVALVMVEVEGKNIFPVDENGERITDPTQLLDKGIYQVFPEKLTWSDGKSMFRKDIPQVVQDAYQEQYTKWHKEQQLNSAVVAQTVEASFGIPVFDTTLDESGKKVRTYENTSVEDAQLVSASDLRGKPVVYVPTLDEKFAPYGRVVLKLKNGFVRLFNRKLNKDEASAVYDAVLATANNALSGKLKTVDSQRVLNWLKSVVYWGTPKGRDGTVKPAGRNSIWFDKSEDGELTLFIGNNDKSFPFTPSAIEENKAEILTILSGMYGNVNSTMTSDKNDRWSEPYEQITSISKDGTITSKRWDNYQTFLLSNKDRKVGEIPLTTQLKKIEGPDDTNRDGVYFTVKDNEARFAVPATATTATPKVIKPVAAGVVETGENEFFIPAEETGTTLIGTTSKGEKFNYTIVGNDINTVKVIKDDLYNVIDTRLGGKDTENRLKKNIYDQLPATAKVVTKPAAIQQVGENEYFIPDDEAAEAQIDSDMQAKIQAAEDADNSPFRVAASDVEKVFKKENWGELSTWLTTNFPNVPVYRVKNVISATNGQQAWGMLKDGAIYLYEGGEQGTAYHEVFEAVWKMFSDTKEKEAITKEFNSRKGSFVDRPTGRDIEYSEATAQEAKEQLAEEFRDFVMKGTKPPRAGKSLIGKLFADIVAFINKFFRGKEALSNTEKLFQKIGNGYYKQFIPYQSQLAYGKRGYIDIEDAYADAGSEFRVAGMTGEDVHEVMQQMTYDAVLRLFGDNESLFNMQTVDREVLYSELKEKVQNNVLVKMKEQQKLIDEGLRTKEEVQPTLNRFSHLYKTINSEWKSLRDKHEEYLRTYSIEFDEDNNAQLVDEDNSGKSDYQDATKIDTFKTSSSAIKILLATLPIVDNNGKIIKSGVNGVRLLPLSEVFMAIMNKVHSSRNIDEMLERIGEMGVEDSNYRKLYYRLTKSNYNTGSPIELSNLEDTHDLQLLTTLYKTFKKQNPLVKNLYMFGEGDNQVGDSNFGTATNQVQSTFVNSLVDTLRTEKKYFYYDEGKKAYVPKLTNSVPIASTIDLGSDDKKLNFLGSLGIVFTNDEFSKMNSEQRLILRNAALGIKESLVKVNEIRTLSANTISVRGRLRDLAQLKVTLDNPEFDSTYFNVNNERVQAFIGTNPASDLYDNLSQINNLSELSDSPFAYLLTDVFSEGSVILDKMFDRETGKRNAGNINLMKPGYVDGTVNQESGKKKESSKQSYKERIVQEMNMNLQGIQYALVPGDASMEHMLYMGNHITTSVLAKFGNDDVERIFKGYFISELKLVRDDRSVKNSGEMRFFRGILGDKLHNKVIADKGTPEEVYNKYEKLINGTIKDMLDQEVTNTYSLMQSYGLVNTAEDGTYLTEEIAFPNNRGMSKEALMLNIKALSANYIINNIELHKLIFSDPYQYADELKRIKNFSSPRQPVISGSAMMNSVFNKVWNKGYSEGDIGYTDMNKDSFATITYYDVLNEQDLPGYKDDPYEETDGSGIMFFKSYRNLRIRAADWNSDNERQYRYDVAWEKDHKGMAVSKDEQKLLDKGNPDVKSTYTPIKPIVSGNKADGQDYNDSLLDKFAIYPVSYRLSVIMNPASNSVKLYNKMQKENKDYVIFKSGRKVGAEVLNDVYDAEGNFNETPYEGTINVAFSTISIQSEVPSKDDNKVTRGSQATKLATLDMLDAGVPADFMEKAKFQDKYEKWNGMTEEQKVTASPLYKEIKHNQSLLESMTENGYQILLKKLGIEEVKGGYAITNVAATAETLKEEIMKREVNDNISDALNGFSDGDVILEATPAYQQIRNILYSIADKNIISPKINGGQKVQIPSTLFEEKRIKPTEVNGKMAYTSDVLSFYKNEDGKRVCEVFVGRWFKSNKSDKELLDYLNNTEEGKKILSGIGFRIPTQRQNSIDSFVIKGFLPREFGDSVVIPSALVKKAGSDFDIDKLTMYFKNTYMEKDYPKLVPFFGMGEEAKNQIKKYFLEKDLKSIFEIDERVDSSPINDYDDVYKQSLENEYIQSLQTLVSHEKNFDNLIKPNSAEQMKDLATDVSNRLGLGSFDYQDPNNMLRRDFMSRLRHAFVRGKYAIGIAARNQTQYSLNQRTTIYIDTDKIAQQVKQDRDYLGDGQINLPHNTIRVNDKTVATLSMVKNTAGQNISDINSQFIDGYVDISKGPWIMELGATPNVASTWMFLVQVGVPIDHIAYFMNQPIIKDYLREVETAGYSWLFISTILKDLTDSSKYATAKGQLEKITTLPSKTSLRNSIGKKEFSEAEKAEQQFILKEFLKYAKMAGQMFTMSQGTNFDTANLNDPFLVYKKVAQLELSKGSIISSAEDILESSFLNKLMNVTLDTRDALATILTSDKPNVRKVVQKVLLPFISMNDKDFVKLARKAVNDVFDWAVHIDKHLNAHIKEVLLDEKGSVKKVADFVNTVKKNPNHKLYNNQVIKILQPIFSQKEGGVNNLMIKNKDNKVYDQNQIIYAFKEIENYLRGKSDLYASIVGVAILQSGLSNSKIAYTSLLPYEAFKKNYNDTLIKLEGMVDLSSFATLNVFQRNNWNDDDVVPQEKAKWTKGFKYYNANMRFLPFSVKNAIAAGEIPQVMTLSAMSRASASEVISYTWDDPTVSKEYKKKMIASGDFSYKLRGLFQKVYNEDGTAVVSTDNKENEYFIYKMINAWGDSYRANEFYKTGQKSQIDNGFQKANEVDDKKIAPLFAAVEANKQSYNTKTVADSFYVQMPKSGETTNKINIYAGTGENSELSNFATRPFEYRGIKYNNVEGAFQAAKLDYAQKSQSYNDENTTTEEYKQGFSNLSGALAKQQGNSIKGLDTKTWDKNSSKIMKELLTESFKQNPEALKKLLATGNVELTHTQDTSKWGKEFPKLLMEVRAELSPISKSATITVDDPAFKAYLLANPPAEDMTAEDVLDYYKKCVL